MMNEANTSSCILTVFECLCKVYIGNYQALSDKRNNFTPQKSQYEWPVSFGGQLPLVMWRALANHIVAP